VKMTPQRDKGLLKILCHEWEDVLHCSAAKGGPHKSRVAIDQKCPVYHSPQKFGSPELLTFAHCCY